MANIDELIAEHNAKPQRKKAPRKGNNPEKAAVEKVSRRKNPDLPVLLDEFTRAYQIARMLAQGYSIEQVAEKLDITPAKARIFVEEAMRYMRPETATLLSNWSDIELMRTNEILSKLYDHLWDDVGKPNIAILEQFRAEREYMRKVVDMMTKRVRDEPDPNKMNETMPRSSRLYDEANANINAKYGRGEVERDEEIIVLDGLLTDRITYDSVEHPNTED